MQNFSWFFLKAILSKKKMTELKLFISHKIKEIIDKLRKEQQDKDLRYYNVDNKYDLKEINSSNWLEIGIQYIKKIGNYEHLKPLIRIIIGENNFVMFIQQLNADIFPQLSRWEELSLIISQIEHLLEDFIITHFRLEKRRDYLLFHGHHNCVLNCGGCCNGREHTMHPLQGGLYCKAQTNIGKFCLYKLFNVDLPPGHEICNDYYCYEISLEARNDPKILGCYLKRFIPHYSQSDINEFFKIINSITKSKDKRTAIKKIVEKTYKSDEIDLFWSKVNKLKKIMKKYVKIYPTVVKNLNSKLSRNQFERCLEILQKKENNLSNSPKNSQFKQDIELMRNYLASLIKWKQMYNKRINRYKTKEIPLFS
ncbi:MAG: hypothetical protein GF364_12075 [Candidatus Lokiarchaeota archaeon]|nr:hypothetical protein [Candidatus Lokiarchaeota archaeon]